jgi:hypothetical protein
MKQSDTSDLLEQLRTTREQARRARRLALGIHGDPAAERLMGYAEELEKRARGLEALVTRLQEHRKRVD